MQEACQRATTGRVEWWNGGNVEWWRATSCRWNGGNVEWCYFHTYTLTRFHGQKHGSAPTNKFLRLLYPF